MSFEGLAQLFEVHWRAFCETKNTGFYNQQRYVQCGTSEGDFRKKCPLQIFAAFNNENNNNKKETRNDALVKFFSRAGRGEKSEKKSMEVAKVFSRDAKN